MFKCKICSEKDARIVDLKEQIQSLRNIITPPQRINKYELEEAVVMNGGGQEIVPTDPKQLEEEFIENMRIQRETDFIFSGNDEALEVGS